MTQVFKARWILPVETPPIEDGAIVVQDDRIVDVCRASDLPDISGTDFGDCLIVPGFINPHTHLELTNYYGCVPRAPLWEWFAGLMELRPRPGAADIERAAISEGASLSLEAGVTCVGDISRTGIQVAELAASPIRKVCYIELISGAVMTPNDLPSLRSKIESLLRYACPDHLMIGISPHTLYTVLQPEIAGCVHLAAEYDLPLTTHVLETQEEAAWLRGRGEWLSRFLSNCGLPTASEPHCGGAMDRLDEAGVLRRSPLLAHMNYADATDAARLASSDASVVWCPRAHAFFGHTDHPWRIMLDKGTNVCIGTDSLASNESLSILDELRYLRERFRDIDAGVLLEMGTIRSARAMGLAGRLGSLAAGKAADLVVIPLDAGGATEPLANLLDGRQSPIEVWISGDRVWPTC